MESEVFFKLLKNQGGAGKKLRGLSKIFRGQKPFGEGQKSFWGAPPAPLVAESQSWLREETVFTKYCYDWSRELPNIDRWTAQSFTVII